MKCQSSFSFELKSISAISIRVSVKPIKPTQPLKFHIFSILGCIYETLFCISVTFWIRDSGASFSKLWSLAPRTSKKVAIGPAGVACRRRRSPPTVRCVAAAALYWRVFWVVVSLTTNVNVLPRWSIASLFLVVENCDCQPTSWWMDSTDD